MKKSLLAVFISSVLLTACNEKEITELNEKIQQSEQTVSQLQADLAKSKADLTQSQAEITQLKTAFPTLKTGKETLFKKEQTLKFDNSDKPKDTLWSEEANINYEISTVNTGFKWLDDLLLDYMINVLVNKEQPKPTVTDPSDKKALLTTVLEKYYAEDLDTLKEEETRAITLAMDMNYEGQRDNIATFSLFQDVYSGGAHGMYFQYFINVDTDSQKIITLQDLTGNQEELKEALWNAYLDQNGYENEDGKVTTFTSKEDFYVSTEFYFSPQGINFVYPPYALGAYAEGIITLTIWNGEFINKPFWRN